MEVAIFKRRKGSLNCSANPMKYCQEDKSRRLWAMQGILSKACSYTSPAFSLKQVPDIKWTVDPCWRQGHMYGACFISASSLLTTRLGCRHTGQKNSNLILTLPGLPSGAIREQQMIHSSNCLQLDTCLKMNRRAYRKGGDWSEIIMAPIIHIPVVLWFTKCFITCLPLILPLGEHLRSIVQNSNSKHRDVKTGICSQSYSSFKTWILNTNAPIQIPALLLRGYVTLGNYLTSLWPHFVICEMELRIVSTGKVVVEIKWQDACQILGTFWQMVFSKFCRYIYKTFDGSQNIFSSTVFVKHQSQILC